MSDLFLSNLVGTLRDYFRVGSLRLVNSSGTHLDVKDKTGSAFRNVRASAMALRPSGAAHDVSISASAPESDITFLLPDNLGSAGYALTTDGSGVLGWSRCLRVADRGVINLVSGYAFVTSSAVTADSVILLGNQQVSGTFGALAVQSRGVGSSFSIASSSLTDNSTVAWVILHP